MMPKEHFIIFDGESIRAIYADLKTQTRRVIVPQPEFFLGNGWPLGKIVYGLTETGVSVTRHEPMRCRYGQLGDRLWVKEIYATPGNYDEYKPSELKWHCQSADLAYKATEQYGDVYFTWRSAMFMPYWAHRLDLDVITIKPERLQDISQADAKAEGAACPLGVPEDVEIGYVLGFKRRWDALNAKRGYPWSSNPWVWAIEFKRVKT